MVSHSLATSSPLATNAGGSSATSVRKNIKKKLVAAMIAVNPAVPAVNANQTASVVAGRASSASVSGRTCAMTSAGSAGREMVVIEYSAVMHGAYPCCFAASEQRVN
jgi:hypothetical protein